jgi:hypothetical protein
MHTTVASETCLFAETLLSNGYCVVTYILYEIILKYEDDAILPQRTRKGKRTGPRWNKRTHSFVPAWTREDVVSSVPFLVHIPWREWLEFPVGVFLVLSKEIKSGAPYTARVLDIEIPSTALQEM